MLEITKELIRIKLLHVDENGTKTLDVLGAINAAVNGNKVIANRLKEIGIIP